MGRGSPYRVSAKAPALVKTARWRVVWGITYVDTGVRDTWGNSRVKDHWAFLVQKKGWIFWGTVDWFNDRDKAIRCAERAAERFKRYGNDTVYWTDADGGGGSAE